MSFLKTLQTDLHDGKKIRIVFIGDSITSTEWVHPNWREIVEYVLKEELTTLLNDWKTPSWNIRCFNCGFDGSNTEDIIRLLKTEILPLKPTIAIYLENTNDLPVKNPVQTNIKNMRKIVLALSKKCKNVFIATSIPGNNREYNKRCLPFIQALKKVAFPDNATLIDTYEDLLKEDLSQFFTFTSLGNEELHMKQGSLDFVHPNHLGNAYIAKSILRAFGITFDPEKFIKETHEGKMYPGY